MSGKGHDYFSNRPYNGVYATLVAALQLERDTFLLKINIPNNSLNYSTAAPI